MTQFRIVVSTVKAVVLTSFRRGRAVFAGLLLSLLILSNFVVAQEKPRSAPAEKAKKKAGVKPKKTVFIGGDGLYHNKFISIGGKAAEGAYVLSPYVNDKSKKAIKEFAAGFKKKYKKEPDAWGALTYDTIGLLAQVIGKVGADREKIRAGLAAMDSADKGYRGITGVSYFDKNGDSLKPSLFGVVRDGQFSLAKLQSNSIDYDWTRKKGAKKVANGPPIWIGLSAPLTGFASAFGKVIKFGARLKIEEINREGGINGRPLKLIVVDDSANNEKAVRVAKQLVKRKKLVAVVGPFTSTCALAAQRVYRDAKIATVSPSAMHPTLCKGSKWSFRSVNNDQQIGEQIAEFLKTNLKRDNVIIFFDNDDYGDSLSRIFREHAKRIGLKVLKVIPYNRESTSDFEALVSQVKGTKTDAIFVAGLYGEAGQIAKAAKKLGLLK